MSRDLCQVWCRRRIDPAAGPTHPGCTPGPVLSPDDEARVLALLYRVLGAAPIEEEQP